MAAVDFVYMHNRTFSPAFELKVCLGMQILKCNSHTKLS